MVPRILQNARRYRSSQTGSNHDTFIRQRFPVFASSMPGGISCPAFTGRFQSSVTLDVGTGCPGRKAAI